MPCYAYTLSTIEEVAAAVERQPLRGNRRPEQDPFDIVGNVHGCNDELEQQLA